MRTATRPVLLGLIWLPCPFYAFGSSPEEIAARAPVAEIKVKEGVALTLRQLNAALEKGRVVPINPVGEKFDPHRHQAISMVPSEQEANTVVAVLQKGFLIADRVLRPALVTVTQAK